MAILLYILICLIWGSTWIAIKIGLTQAPPLYTAGFRFIIAFFILVTIVKVKGLSYPKSYKAFLTLGYPGLYMYGASYALIYFSELYISSALAAVLFASFPFFVALLSFRSLKNEKLNALGWLGLFFGLTGVILISIDSLQTSRDLFLGTLLSLAGSFAAAYGMILHKKDFSRENIFVAATVQMSCGGLILVPAALIFEKWSDFIFSIESIGSIVYLAVFGSVIAFLGYYWLLARTRAVTVSLIAFITPIVAIFIGVLFFSENLSLLIILGTILILSGILMVERK